MQTRVWMAILAAGLAVALPRVAAAADYFADPVAGNMANPGTSESPWSTLADVFAAGKVFEPGDTLHLRRGYHGVAAVTGINTGDVFIVADAGHTPTVRLSLLNAHHWFIRGLTILGAVAVDNQTNENSDHNTFENCYLPNGGFTVAGNFNTLRGNHIRGGGIQWLYHSNSGLISGNTLEDFYSDGMGMKGNYNLVESNLVMNAHKVSGNHNDLFQGWASTGNILRGNEFRAYSDPNQPDLAQPGVSDVQGIGLFDGWYVNWVIENNVVFVDHPIGIWLHGAQGCQVKNNTVLRCGQTAILDPRYPNIRVSAKKSGAASTGNVVINNAAERFELDPADNAGVSVGVTTNNVVVPKSAFGSTFLDWAKKDLHLKAGAGVIDAGTASNAPPVVDADGNARPFNAAWDCGAFEYGEGPAAADTAAPSQPTGVTAVVVAGYGVDLNWLACTDNRKVTGYDIYRNGVQVGRTRAGTNYMDITTNTASSYTVRAFDHAGNASVQSAPVGGTPPVPDEAAPTVPSNLVAVAVSSHLVQLGWQASTDNVAVTGYEVYRDGNLLTTVSGTNHTDGGLTPSTLYSYTVKARDSAGNVSDASAAAGVTTFDPDVTSPSVPAGVSAMAASSGSIVVRWLASTDDVGVAGYDVYRDGVVVGATAGTNFTDTGLAPLTAYGYAVSARDADGNLSATSAPPAVATTLEPVPVLVGESFVYAPGSPLSGLDGGTGWDGGWAVGAAATYPTTVLAGSLGGAPGQVRHGSHLRGWAEGNGTIYQNLDRSFETLIADGAQTVWLGLLVALSDAKNPATLTLTGLRSDPAGTNEAALFTLGATTPATFRFGAATLFTGDAAYTPHLVLVRLALSGDAGPEAFTAYVDPDLGAAPESWTGVTNLGFYANDGLIGVSYRGGRASSPSFTSDVFLDEIRIGATWQAAVGQEDPPGDVEPPSVPDNVTAVATSAWSVWLGWNASTDNVGVATYTVYRDGTNVATVAGTTYTNTGLLPETLYVYTVTATDGDGNESAASAPAGVTTPAEVVDGEAPSVPSNVTAVALSSASIRVSWWAATDNVGVAGYQVYRGGALVGTPVTTNFIDTGLAASTLYSYTVKALDATGNVSAASAPAAATTMAPVVAMAEESFTNAAGALVGLTGGTGWSGGWQVESHYDLEAAGHYEIADGGLASYPGLATAGGYASFLSGGGGTFYPYAQRNLATPVDDDGGIYWFAFQLQTAGFHKDSTYTLAGASVPFVRMKLDATNMNFQFLNGAYYAPGDTNAHLFLIKIQMSGDTNVESAALYFDPDLSTNATAWTALRTGTFAMTNGPLTAFRSDSARAGNAGYRVQIDEIRLATTWEAAVGQGGGGPVDPDADHDGLPDAWETEHFGSTTNAQGDAGYDWDGDGLDNASEYEAGTNPTNASSVLVFSGVSGTSAAGLVLQWQSVSGKSYAIQSATNLFAAFQNTANTNILATGGSMSRTVGVTQVGGFYRVVVE